MIKYVQIVVNTPLAMPVSREKEQDIVSESLGEEDLAPVQSLVKEDARAALPLEDAHAELPDEEVEPAESPYDRTFTYSIPERLAGQIALGQLVWVPFGKRRLQGVIVAFSDTSPVEQTKDIEEIVDPRPFLSQVHLDLARWIALTYLCAYNSAIQMMLPLGIAQQTEILLSLAPDVARDNLTPKQTALVELLARDGETKLRALPRELHSAIEPLARRGSVVKHTTIAPPRAKPQRIKAVRMISDKLPSSLMFRVAQVDVLEHLAFANRVVTVKELRSATKCTPLALNKLAEKKFIVIQSSLDLLVPIASRRELRAIRQTVQCKSSKQVSALVAIQEHGRSTNLETLKRLQISKATIRVLAGKGFVKINPQSRFVRLVDNAKTTRDQVGVETQRVLRWLGRHKRPVPLEMLQKATGCDRVVVRNLVYQNLIEVFTQPLTVIPILERSVESLCSSTTRKLLAAIDSLRMRRTPIPYSEFRNQTGLSPALIRKLIDLRCVRREKKDPTVLLNISPLEALSEASQIRKSGRLNRVVDFLKHESGAVWVSALYAETGCTRADLQKLETAGVVALEEEEVWRDSLAGRVFDVVELPKLTPEQERVWKEIAVSLRGAILSERSESKDATKQSPTSNLEIASHPLLATPQCFLLHGVTGSGKTEIYMRALAEIIAQGKQGIVLVPEISLTPQTIRRFGARFKRVAVVHSQLSIGERYDTWRRCRDGLVDVVIGARSALFAPLPNLGLIAMDEEHDPSYKQAEVPHYHAREVALELARRVGATVILGDATPDVETYYRATRGEFKLLELPKRVMGHRAVIEHEASQFAIRDSQLATREVGAEYADARYLELPPVEIVDLRAELKAGNRSMFSRALQREMARVLAAHEQVILFLNRRGTATFILCRDCGHVFKCRRCDNPMTYHGAGDQLICHHCNRRDRVPTKCPQCGSARIRYFGVGTEKVEAEIQALFPKARTLRWDWDVTRGKESHEAILEKFITRQADILIGTQMIAKGLDLPFVTLVGVVSADTSLNLPDFRAGERTFQLLTQVAGRAGRSILGGKVIVQTYNPDHYAIVAASAHDYRAFYEREIAFRREQNYPPYSRLIRLLYSHANEKRAQEESARMYRALTTRIAQRGLPALDLIGPAPAFFHRVRGGYRHQIILRGEDPHALIADLALPLGWRVDVDPVSVL